MDRSEFQKLCLETLEKELRPAYIADWKRIGMSCDWDIFYTTLSDEVRRISQKYFLDLVKKKRGRRYKRGDEGKQLHFALNYALENTVEGPNPMDPGQMIEIGMNQIELEIGFSF